jgi:acetoin utilization deacetylase AcuC-like enzyme
MADVSVPAAPIDLRTAIIHDELFVEHDTGPGHPESPMRYTAVTNGLLQGGLEQKLKPVRARPASDADLTRCHAPGYVELVKRDIRSGAHMLSTGDTAVSKHSLKAALHAAGGACLAVDLVMKSEAKNAFCVLRPPGHHATAIRGMGFCVFNNVAVAARYAQHQHGVGKVLIADWDVHHGNGTQDIFYEDDSVFFFSTHQWPWYPGSGRRDETGRGRGLGTTMNRPFAAGAGRAEIVGAFADDLATAMARFRPELVLLSAGFDSRQGDPLGEFQLSDADFCDLTTILLDIAADSAQGRLVSLLEGGYHLGGLAKATQAHCRTLAEYPRPCSG